MTELATYIAMWRRAAKGEVVAPGLAFTVATIVVAVFNDCGALVASVLLDDEGASRWFGASEDAVTDERLTPERRRIIERAVLVDAERHQQGRLVLH